MTSGPPAMPLLEKVCDHVQGLLMEPVFGIIPARGGMLGRLDSHLLLAPSDEQRLRCWPVLQGLPELLQGPARLHATVCPASDGGPSQPPGDPVSLPITLSVGDDGYHAILVRRGLEAGGALHLDAVVDLV
eukprot:CAMPEP_0197934682 /NCGR_PEP_ID=MMETSP1439-20131203/112203_1 /TAXON_ID=66791 /ORGANISM="Gonyaulax spinifera, Strain CCMP409" /LENGTH=130 /DNA_ID=CAMNT_0043557595 /DNA_START=24 /DNA_END=413 /DNA_ORIENTATION=+